MHQKLLRFPRILLYLLFAVMSHSPCSGQSASIGMFFKDITTTNSDYEANITRLIPSISPHIADTLSSNKNWGAMEKIFIKDYESSYYYFVEIQNQGKHPAYYNLLDIDSEGKIRQIFPSLSSSDLYKSSPETFYLKEREKAIIPFPLRFTPPTGLETFKVISTHAPFSLFDHPCENTTGPQGIVELRKVICEKSGLLDVSDHSTLPIGISDFEFLLTSERDKFLESLDLISSHLAQYYTQYVALLGTRGSNLYAGGVVNKETLFYNALKYFDAYDAPRGRRIQIAKNNEDAILFYHFQSDTLFYYLLSVPNFVNGHSNQNIIDFVQADKLIAASGSSPITIDSLVRLEQALRNKIIAASRPSVVHGSESQLATKGKESRGVQVEISQRAILDLDSLLLTLTKILLPDHLLEKMKGIKHVLIFPSANIARIPFHLLKTGNNDYFIDRFSYSFADSFDSFFKANDDDSMNFLSRTDTVYQFDLLNPIIVGNPSFTDSCTRFLKPLPGAEKEAVSIASKLKVKPYINLEATKDYVLTKMIESNFIYLATHGEADSQDPMNKSWIALSAANSCGKLFTKEIQNIRLKGGISQGALVILSACNSGLGKVHNAGIIGIARAFTIAGAQNVTMSLWNVDDLKTEELMTLYLVELSKSQQFFPAENLRRAILKFKRREPNPYYWAAFQNFGIPFKPSKWVTLKP